MNIGKMSEQKKKINIYIYITYMYDINNIVSAMFELKWSLFFRN